MRKRKRRVIEMRRNICSEVHDNELMTIAIGASETEETGGGGGRI